MSRYTGPQFKLSRRLGISLSGSGKELKRLVPQDNMVQDNARKSVDTVFNCKKSRSFAICMV